MPASSATSSRRRPGVRRRRPGGRPTTLGLSFCRRERRESPSSLCRAAPAGIVPALEGSFHPRIIPGLTSGKQTGDNGASSSRQARKPMQAAVLKAFGSKLRIEDVAEPTLGTGEVIVDVAASRVLPYSNEVFSGERRYQLDLPVVPGPGAIGRVHAVGPDATHLKAGDWVYCDPTVRSRDNLLAPDITLQGLTAGGDGGLKLQKYFRDGAWAERMRVPTENAVALGPIAPREAASWCAMGTCLVPY